MRLIVPLLLAAGFVAAGSAFAQETPPQASPGAREPVCTCAEIVPPFECSAAISPLTARARSQQREIRADCAVQWRRQCEEEHGWRACSQVDPAEVAAQCDEIAEQWWSQVAAPQLAQARSDCSTANDQWAEQCEVEVRAEACSMCEDMSGEITSLETELDAEERWVDSMRGLVVLNTDDDMSLAEREARVDQLQEQLEQRRTNYETLRTAGYCQ